MVKSKSLVKYKMGYNPDATKKTKKIEVEEHGATRTFAIPVVSGDKPIEYQINEQLPIFLDLAHVRGYNGQTKFSNFGQYLSGQLKATWESELQDNYATNNLRTNAQFLPAIRATWLRFYGQPDLRKGGLKYTRGLEWESKHEKYGHTPVQFTQRIVTLYSVLKQMDADPGTTPMPTDRQQKEDLVESFPKEYQEYYDLRGGDYTETMAEIGQIMEDHYNRKHESDSDSDSSSSDEDSDSESSASSSDESDNSSDKKRKRKRKPRKKKKTVKKSKKSKKTSSKKKTKKTPAKSTRDNQARVTRPNVTDPCPVHGGGHTWGDCRLNPRSNNYDPPKPYRREQQQYQGQGQHDGRGRTAQSANQHTQGQQYFIGDNDGSTDRGIPNAPTVPSATQIIRVPATAANPYQSSYANWGTRPR